MPGLWCDKKEGCFQVWLLTSAGVSHHVCWGADQSGSVHEEHPTWRQGRVDDVWGLRGWTAGWDRHLETYLSLSLWQTWTPVSLSLTHQTSIQGTWEILLSCLTVAVVVVVSERPLHPKERVLEQALQWCKMADPSSAYLVVKRVPKGEGVNILTCTDDTQHQTFTTSLSLNKPHVDPHTQLLLLLLLLLLLVLVLLLLLLLLQHLYLSVCLSLCDPVCLCLSDQPIRVRSWRSVCWGVVRNLRSCFRETSSRRECFKSKSTNCCCSKTRRYVQRGLSFCEKGHLERTVCVKGRSARTVGLWERMIREDCLSIRRDVQRALSVHEKIHSKRTVCEKGRSERIVCPWEGMFREDYMWQGTFKEDCPWEGMCRENCLREGMFIEGSVPEKEHIEDSLFIRRDI